jgi:hypothetical protein
MIKVFFLLFEPAITWDKIAQARRGYGYIMATCLLPLLGGVTVLNGWGLLNFGKWQPPFQKIREFPNISMVVGFEAVQFILTLAAVFVSALLILRIAQTFHGRHNYLQAFTVAAYGLSPMLLLGLLDTARSVNPWVTWLVGISFSIWILYQGMPRIIQPDPSHAFGLYLCTVIVIVLTTGMARLFTGLYLLGYMDMNHSFLSRIVHQFS